MEYYEHENVISEETEEKLYEFFFIRNRASDSVSRISMKTVSFDDKPNELLGDDHVSQISAYKEDESEFKYVLNNAIPLEDSDEFDADEFKQNEMRVAIWLALHTGRDGRNGPILQTILEDEPASPVYGDILDFEESVIFDQDNLGVRQKVASPVPVLDANE